MFFTGAALTIGGAIAGALLRQPEINKLKKEVQRLQDQVEELQALLTKQNDTIIQLKTENKRLRATNFIQKHRNNKRTKGVIIFQYAYKDFITITFKQAREENLSEQEMTFFNLFDRMIHGEDVTMAEKGLVKLYVEERYPYQIKHLIAIDTEEVIGEVEGKKVG